MRDDLLALTPETVAAVSNLGLVKRAQREQEAGKGPTLAEEADGTVVGTCDDGAVARLPPGRTLKDAACSCGAPTVCRHRVATALAYRAWSSTPAPVAPASWSPGELGDDTLDALPRRVLDEARALRRRGIVVEVHRSTPADPVPAAILPSATVRFLVPGMLAWARCDCVVSQGCAHAVVAVWAFREADALDPARPVLTVDVRDAVSVLAAPGLDDACTLARQLAVDGVASSRDGLAQQVAVVRARLDAAGDVWPSLALETLEDLLGRYRTRSARYHAAAVTAVMAELEARLRASRGGGELPARFVLGRGEPLETRLDHVRLVGLGARLVAEGRDREVEVLLADPTTGTVLVLRRSWAFAEGELVPEGPGLGRRRLTGATTMAGLAAGQVVTRVAHRRANRELRLSQSSAGATSVTPQTGVWADLGSEVSVRDVAATLAARADRAPRCLRPRVATEDVHAVAVGAVRAVGWDAAEQVVVAEVEDAVGGSFRVARPFRAAAPRSADAVAAALLGRWGPPRFIAGELRRGPLGPELVPTAIAADRVIVPDFEVDVAAVDLIPTSARPPTDRMLAALAAVGGLLDESVHHGMRGVAASWPVRGREVAAELSKVGLTRLGARASSLADAVAAARSSGRWEAASDAWLELAVSHSVATDLAWGE